MLVAAFPDSIWAKLPGREPTASVRNPSVESGPTIPPCSWCGRPPLGRCSARGREPRLPPGVGDRPLAARPLTDVRLEVDVRAQVLQQTSAPNTIGILEGSDPTLKKEYVLFTAHMDHIGTPSAGRGARRGAPTRSARSGRRRLRHGGRDRAGAGLYLRPRAAQALARVHDREWGGAGAFGEAPILPTTPPCRSRT